MSKSYTVMELEAIKYLCKCVNSVASLPADLIADTNVATNTTYSSYKIDAEMSALENDIQRYVDTALAGLNKLSKEVIDDKTLVVKENVLYLYKDPTDMNNDYMQMMLINGAVVELGSTTCNMSGYYTNTEVDDKFALKIDLDVLTTSFNNLVTSVEKKIDKDKIVSVLDDTVTDEQVASAKAVNELKENIKEINDSLVDKVDKEELEDYMNIKYNFLEQGTDLNTLIVAGMYMSKWGESNSLVNKPSGFSSDYEVIVTVTPLKRIGNYGEYIEQTLVSRSPKSPVYKRIIENKAPTQHDWTELATMDKVEELSSNLDELFQSVSDGKTLVANAITDKGVSTSTTATFATMATNIGNIGKINGCKEETKSKTFSTTGTSVLTITFSANVLAIKQIIAPTNSCSIIPQSSKDIFTINGKELIVHVIGGGTWSFTALIQN